MESIRQGAWLGLGAIPVDIPATLGLDRGVWYPIRQGIRGLLVPDERITYLDMTPEQAMKMIVSAGALVPDPRPPAAPDSTP